MIFHTTVTLGDGDSFLYTADAAAAQVLAALGGNPTKDTAYVAIAQQSSGVAGVPPPPLTMPTTTGSAAVPAPDGP